MNVLNSPKGDVHSSSCTLSGKELCGTKDSFFPRGEHLLGDIFHCLPPQLQRLINEKDRERIKDLVTCILELRDPVACRNRVSTYEQFKNEWSGPQEGGPGLDAVRPALFLEAPSLFLPVKAITQTYRVGGVPYGCPPHAAGRAGEADARGSFPCTWRGVVERLMNYCDALKKMLTAENGYKIPRSLQRRLIPALYVWLTDYDFLLDNATYWLTVANLMIKIGHPYHELEVALPWRPLAALLINLVSERDPSKMCGRFGAVLNTVGGVLQRLCETVSMYFDADALGEMWLDFSPRFSSNGDESIIYLFLLCILLPTRQLRGETSTGSYVNPPVKRIVHFLLREAYDWQLQQREAWLIVTLKIISRMFSVNEGLMSLDDYAEPLFSSILHLLNLPIGNDPNDPLAAAGVSLQKHSPSRCQCRRSDRSAADVGSLFSGLAGASMHAPFFSLGVHSTERLRGAPGVVNALTNDTNSPLWSHLRRLLHATSVFIRPGVSAVEATKEVCQLYNGFVLMAYRRVQRQVRYLKRLARVEGDGLGSSAGQAGKADPDGLDGGGGDDDDDDALAAVCDDDAEDPLPLEHVWTRTTIDAFVELMAPVLMPALHLRLRGVYKSMALLISLAPARMLPRVEKYINAALRAPTDVEQQRARVLRLLSAALYPMLGGRRTRAYVLAYLGESLPEIVSWISPSAPHVTPNFIHLLFSAAAALPLRRLFPTPEAECGVMLRVFEHVVAVCEEAHDAIDTGTLSSAETILQTLSDEAYDCVVNHLLSCVADQSSGLCKICLLAAVGRRGAARLIAFAKRVAVPALLGRGTNDAVTSWAARVLSACLSGAGRDAVFPETRLVVQCIHALIAHITSVRRLTDARLLFINLTDVLLRYDCAPAPAPPGDDGLEEEEEEKEEREGDAASPGWLDEIDPDIAARERLLRGLGFCRARDVRLRWDAPGPDHVALVMDLCEEFLGAAMAVAARVREVRPAADPCDGLLGLLPPCGADPCAPDETPRPAFEDGSKSAEEFTPHNVLHGCATWMRFVYLACVPLYYEGGEGPGEEGARGTHLDDVPVVPLRVWPDAAWTEHGVAWCPYWFLSERCALPLPRPAAPRRRLKYDRATLFEFVCTHMLRRFCGDPVAELKRTFGTKAAEVFDLGLLLSGEPPLDASRNGQGDTRALEGVLSFMIGLTGLFSGDSSLYILRFRGKVPTCEIERNYHEKIRHVQLFPAEYWAQRATQVVGTYVASTHHFSCSLAMCRKLLNVAHLLRFLQPNGRVQSFCDSVLTCMFRIVTPPLRRVLYACHLDAINRLTQLWSRKIAGDDDEEGVSVLPLDDGAAPPGERGSPCGGAEGDPRERGGDPFRKAEAREVINSVMHLAFFFFLDLRSFENPDILYHTLCSFSFCPDQLLGLSVKNLFQELGKSLFNLVPYADRQTTHWLVEEVILLASRLAAVSPTRASVYVSIAFMMYHPHGDEPWRMLSTRAVQALFKLSTKPFHSLCVTSMNFLTVFFRSVCGPRSGTTHVPMRRSRTCLPRLGCHDPPHNVVGNPGGSSAEPPSSPTDGDPQRSARDVFEDVDQQREDVEFFQHRYIKLRQWVPFFYVKESGQCFIPHYITVPVGRECFPSNFFEEDEAPFASTDAGNGAVPCGALRRRRFVETRLCDREAALRLWGRTIGVYSGLAMQSIESGDHLHEGKEQGYEKGVRADGWTSPLPESSQESGGGGAIAAERLRGVWVWAAVGCLTELYDHSHSSFSATTMWVLLGRVVGYERSIRYYVLLVRLLLDELTEKLHRKDQTAKESTQSQFAVLMDLCLAVLRLSKDYVLREWAIHASDAVCDDPRRPSPALPTDSSSPAEFTPVPETSAAAMNLRARSLQCYVDALLYTCRRSVPNELSRVAASTFGRLNNSLNAQEMWWLFETLLNTLTATTNDERHETPYEDGFSSIPPNFDRQEGFLGVASVAIPGKVSVNMRKTVCVMMYLSQIVRYTNPEWTGELLPKLTHCIRANQGLFFSSTTSYSSFWAASVPRLLLRWCLNQSGNIPGNDRLLEDLTEFALEIISWAPISSLADSALLSGSASSTSSISNAEEASEGRAPVGTTLRAAGPDQDPLPPIMATTTTTTTTTAAGLQGGRPSTTSWPPTPVQSSLGPPNSAIDASFLTPALLPRVPNAVEREKGFLEGIPPASRGVAPTPSLLPAASPTSVASASAGGHSPTLLEPGCPSPSLLPTPMVAPGGFARPEELTPQTAPAASPLGEPEAPNAAALVPVKTVLFCLQFPPAALVGGCARPLLALLIAALNLSFARVDSLHGIAEGVLAGVVGLRLPKAVAHALLALLCEALAGGGCSPRCRGALARALGGLLFHNAHRVGRYAAMRAVVEAALATIGRADGRLRAHGVHLFAVLTKVASTAQTVALLRGYAGELRAAAVPAPGETSGRRRYVALVLLQCAALAADPGTIPAYIPGLMARLAPYARSPVLEVQRAVKKSFEAWWRSHREGWEVEYKHCFTASQLEAIATLLMAPTYYV